MFQFVFFSTISFTVLSFRLAFSIFDQLYRQRGSSRLGRRRLRWQRLRMRSLPSSQCSTTYSSIPALYYIYSIPSIPLSYFSPFLTLLALASIANNSPTTHDRHTDFYCNPSMYSYVVCSISTVQGNYICLVEEW